VFVLIGALSLLVLLSVGEKSLAADSAALPAAQTTADALLAVRDWVHGFLIFLPFLVGALMYYYVLYRSRLVPRWLSCWGLVGAALGLVATVYSGFVQEFGFTTLNTFLNIPIALQEMVFAVWLIAKGFNLPTARSIAPEDRAAPAPYLRHAVRT
jgi:hypothetical protein